MATLSEGAFYGRDDGFTANWKRVRELKRTNGPLPTVMDVLFHEGRLHDNDGKLRDTPGYYGVATMISNYFITELGNGSDAGRRKFLNFLDAYTRSRDYPQNKELAFAQALHEIYNGLSLRNFLTNFQNYLDTSTQGDTPPRHDSPVNGCEPQPDNCPVTRPPVQPTVAPGITPVRGIPTVVIYGMEGCGPCIAAKNQFTTLASANNNAFRVSYEESWPNDLLNRLGQKVGDPGGRPVIVVKDASGRIVYAPFNQNNQIVPGYDQNFYNNIVNVLRNMLPNLRP